MSITFWTWNTPNGRKISVALEEMGLAYTVKPVNISKGEQFNPEFLAFSPNNRIPAIQDPDGPDEIQADASGHFDLGEALAEELSLSLNPYPRAAGAHLPAALEDPAEEPAPRNPFAKLAALRGGKT